MSIFIYACLKLNVLNDDNLLLISIYLYDIIVVTKTEQTGSGTGLTGLSAGGNGNEYFGL